MVGSFQILALSLIFGFQYLSGNFATDIVGVLDTRPNTWGKAEAQIHKLTFTRYVRLYSIQGDTVAWVRNPEEGRKAGILVGFQKDEYNTDCGGLCDYASNNTIIYLQGVLDGSGTLRIPFDYKFPGGILIKELYIKQAIWLSDLEQPVHMETTFTLRVK